MNQILVIAQIIISILLIALILLQQRGTALGSTFGGEGGFYATRRGAEKKIFWATVGCGTAFVILSILNIALA